MDYDTETNNHLQSHSQLQTIESCRFTQKSIFSSLHMCCCVVSFLLLTSVFINGALGNVALDIRCLYLMVGFLDVGCISDSLVLNSTKLHISL